MSILRHQGYLPFDSTGDWLYHFLEAISLLAVVLGCYAVIGPLISTYEEKYDKFGNLHIPNELGALYVVVPSIILAIIFHP
jgi:ER lumen protein retaining receptor